MTLVAPAIVELHTLAQYSALGIVECLVEGSIVALFAATLLCLARRHNAGTRFAIGFSALLAIALMPLLSGLLSSALGFNIQSASRPAVTVPDSWAMYLFGAWALIAGFFLLRIGRALWHLHVVRKNCAPIDLALLDPSLQQILRDSRINRPVAICTSQQLRIPTALGLTKAAIVIPKWAMDELSAAELSQILLHELAHLRRRDDWTNLIQQLVRAILFFHPAVWWIENKVALDREIACDDAVLAQTASPRAYAECLAHLAERSFVQRSLALAQAALGRIRQTSSRVANILNGNRPAENHRNWKSAVALVGGFAIVCALSASRAPKLIAFQNSRSQSVASQAVIKSAQQDDLSYGAMGTLPVTQAALKTEGPRRSPAIQKHAIAARSTNINAKTDNTLRLTRYISAATPITEAVFVVIQRPENGSIQEWYQVQMWHITLVRTVIEPAANKTPPRKT